MSKLGPLIRCDDRDWQLVLQLRTWMCREWKDEDPKDVANAIGLIFGQCVAALGEEDATARFERILPTLRENVASAAARLMRK